MIYLIKCIIRRIINLLIRPKNLIVFILVGLLLLTFLTQAGYCATTEVPNPNESILTDFIFTTYEQRYAQLFSIMIPEFINDTDFWRDCLKPTIYDYLTARHSLLSYAGFVDKDDQISIQFTQNWTTTSTTDATTPVSVGGTLYLVNLVKLNSADTFNIVYDKSKKTFTKNRPYGNIMEPSILMSGSSNVVYKPSIIYDFVKFVESYDRSQAGGGVGVTESYNQVLADILATLNKIEENTQNTGAGGGSVDVSGIVDKLDELIKVQQDMIKAQEKAQSLTQEQLDTAKEQLKAQQQQVEEQKKMNDFLKDDNVDQSNMTVPTDNTKDPTESGFDNIFSTVQKKLTSDDYEDIVIPIPFTEKSITIDPDFLYKALGKDNFIITLISSLTYFFVSSFIVKDIARIVDKIKTGDITSSAETNIKTDML